MKQKNGRTLGQDIVIVRRGVKEFNRILPGQMRRVFLKSIFIAAFPFLTTAVSAALMDELLENPDWIHLIMICLFGVLLIFVLTLWKNELECRIAVWYERLFSTHEIGLTQKAYHISYEELEKSSTRKLRDEVSGSINLSGAGMASLYWDMEVIFTRSFTVLLSFVFFLSMIRRIVLWDLSQNGSLFNSIGMLLLLVALVGVCSYISCRTAGKRFDVSFDVFQEGSQYSRYGEFYSMNYLADEDAAMDARIYDQEDLILSECQEKCYEHFAEGKRREIHAINGCDGLKLVSSCVCGCFLYIVIGQKALHGAIGCGSILLMVTAVTSLITALAEIAQIVTDLRNNNEHLLRYFEYMDLPEEGMIQQQEELPEPAKDRQILFQNVSFRYPESDALVLKNITLEIQAGEKLALVGENGCGKTTLIKLLCRLYKPTEGHILLNGMDIWKLPYEDYMAHLATVFQDFSLFAFSLAENIAACRDYNPERVMAAIKKAGLKEKTDRLEKGIEQSLFHYFDEDGTDLSGGEGQKVAIARALYKEAPVMVLDEPTAALDPYAEYEIYKNFGRIAEEKTVISISHRLSSCRMCDRIAVMHNGEIVECGTHEELLHNEKGKYFELWQAQAQYYQ